MSTSAQLQPTWFLSAATGNNRNSGLDSGHPIRDCAERQRRVGNAPVTQPTTITYLDSPSTTDIEMFNRVPIGVGGSLTLAGTRTVVATGTLTGFTTFNRGTQTKNSIADTGLSGGFAAHVGRYMRITSGPRLNVAWVVTKDLGGGSAEISTPGTTSTASFGSFARGTPQVGDAYEIVTVPILRAGIMDFAPGSQQRATTGFARVVMQDLEIDFGNQASGTTTDFASGLVSEFIKPILVRCKLDAMSVRANAIGLFQCYHFGYILVTSASSIFMSAGAHTSHVQVNTGAYARLDFDELLQGGQLTLSRGGTVELGTVAIFDKGGDAVALNPSAVAIITPLSDSTGLLWGTNNTGRGINLQSGSQLKWFSSGGNKPTVNLGLGLGREVLMGDTDFLYADVPVEARGASIGVWP